MRELVWCSRYSDEATDWMTRVSDLGKGKYFLLQNVQIGFEAHPAFCLTRNGVLSRV